MKVIILAGGLGTRIQEFTKTIPKPMIKLGRFPMLIHIMKHYIKYGYKDFIIAAGYKSEVIKKYFKNFKKNGISFPYSINKKNKCTVTILDTGKKTLTGGRLKRVGKLIEKNEDFMFTYGDGLSNVNLKKLVNFHNKKKKLATVTAVKPLARFGAMDIENDNVTDFIEKPKSESGWINGGFFVLSFDVIKYISGCLESWEKGPLQKIVKDNQLVAYKHSGFWQPMDTLREKFILEDLWKKGNAPWTPKAYKNKNILAFKKSVNI